MMIVYGSWTWESHDSIIRLELTQRANDLWQEANLRFINNL